MSLCLLQCRIREDWSQEDLVKYNFESPWVDGSRVEKLRALFDT